MDDTVRDQLGSVLDARAPADCENAPLIESILLDLFGSEERKREISALVGAVKEEVPTELRKAAKYGPPPPTLGDRLVRRLEGIAIDREAAHWAVWSWAILLEVNGLRFSAPSRSGRLASSSISRPGFAQAQACIARLAGTAAQIAVSLPADGARPVALATAAAGLATTDASRSLQLLAEAEGLLRWVNNKSLKTSYLHAMSIALAATYPSDAERLALSIDGLLRDDALANIADVLGEGHFDWAVSLASRITDEPMRMHTLAGLASTAAGASPDRAVDLARSLTAGYWRAEALCNVAAVIAIDYPARALELIREAEDLAWSIADQAASAAALSSVARALARTDPDRAAVIFGEAGQLAGSVGEGDRAVALGSLAIALAPSDPEKALDIAMRLPDNWYATGEIAKLLAYSQADRALQLAQSITEQTPHIAEVAALLTYARPEGAILLARSIGGERVQASALIAIAKILARTSSDRAAQLLEEIEQSAMQWTDSLDKVAVLADVAAAWATG